MNLSNFTVFRYTVIVLGTLALAFLIVATLDVWTVLIVAILIASAVRPLVNRLTRMGIPQTGAILVVYGFLLFSFILMFVAVLPPVINQLVSYIQNEDRLANRIVFAQFWVERTLSQITGTEVEIGIPSDDIRSAVRDLVETVRVTAPNLIDDISGFIGDAILILVMGVYWITSRQRTEEFLVGLMPINRQSQVRAIIEEIEYGLGAYVRGIALVSLIIGGLSFIAMAVLRVPNASTLAFIYGLSTAIPIIGGLVGVVLATAIALLASPTSALVVLIVTVILQQFENYYLSPRIVSQSTSFDEILVIVFIAAGFSLDGLAGALIAVPVAGTAVILLKHLVIQPRLGKIAPNRVQGGILLEKDSKTDDPPDKPT